MKAHLIQSKRRKDERKKKEEERRLKRLEKQSPRKRNQSQEFDGRRKRKESGGQLSPRKRLKDSDPISKPKIERSFTETGIRDPIIKKKKQVEIRDYSSAFEAEYAMNSVVFSKLMRLCYTESTYQLLEKLLEDSKSWPLVPVYDPFADENQVKSVVEDTLKMSADLNHAAKVAVMQTSIPTWLKNATYFQKEPFQSGAKQFGLFSNHDLTANCFVSEICGRVSSLEDLYLKHNFLIPLPVDEQVAKNTDILPPFVFPLPKFTDSEDSTHTQLFLDARDTANFDARFVQASCDLDKVNAEFKLVVVINESEIGDRVKYDRNTSTTETDEAQPLINLSSRFKLCLFTTKLVKATDEIVIANPVNNFYHFSCSCTITCKILESVKIIEDFRNQDYAGTSYC